MAAVPTSALVLIGIAAGAGMLVVTYEVSDYWENAQLVKEIQQKTNDINVQRNEIILSYEKGDKTKDECMKELNELLAEAEAHLKFVKDEVSFLNMSHNYKNIKQTITYLQEDIDFFANM